MPLMHIYSKTWYDHSTADALRERTLVCSTIQREWRQVTLAAAVAARVTSPVLVSARRLKRQGWSYS